MGRATSVVAALRVWWRSRMTARRCSWFDQPQGKDLLEGLKKPRFLGKVESDGP
jgi:hypothetical protein